MLEIQSHDFTNFPELFPVREEITELISYIELCSYYSTEYVGGFELASLLERRPKEFAFLEGVAETERRHALLLEEYIYAKFNRPPLLFHHSLDFVRSLSERFSKDLSVYLVYTIVFEVLAFVKYNAYSRFTSDSDLRVLLARILEEEEEHGVERLFVPHEEIMEHAILPVMHALREKSFISVYERYADRISRERWMDFIQSSEFFKNWHEPGLELLRKTVEGARV